MKIMSISTFATIAKTEYLYKNQGQYPGNIFDLIRVELDKNHLATQCEFQDVPLGVFNGCAKKHLVVAGQQEDLLIGIAAQAYGDFFYVFIYMAIAPCAGSVIKGLALGAIRSDSYITRAGVLSRVNISDLQEINMFWASTLSCVETALAVLGKAEIYRGPNIGDLY